MKLYDENENAKKSKAPMIIGICIGVLVLLTILIICGIIYISSTMTTIKIDGERNSELGDLFYIVPTEDGQEVYMPITKVAPFLGYKGYAGDFQNKSEDNTKCYVENDYESAMFSVNSDVLIKATKDSEYEYVKLDKAVFEKDGELYTTIEGIENACNIYFSYDDSFKNINIFTMDYLVEYSVEKLGIKKYSEEFVDKKAILEDMLIIEEDGQIGVINAENGQPVLETKYEEITYLPATKDFLVKSNKKYGVVGKDKSTKVRTVYDEIKIMDNKNGLYLVKQNNAYGVVNTAGEVIIEPEYKQIGIDKDKYAQNGVENKYVLLGEIIPMQNDQDLWGFVNIKGEQITDFKYTGVGCTITEVTNSYPALIIPSYNVIVVENEKHYNLITSEGEELIPGYILDTVYLKSNTATAQNQFFMTYNDNAQIINVEEWLANIGR